MGEGFSAVSVRWRLREHAEFASLGQKVVETRRIHVSQLALFIPSTQLNGLHGIRRCFKVKGLWQ